LLGEFMIAPLIAIYQSAAADNILWIAVDPESMPFSRR
jgi:hypothetical protein